MRFWSIKIVKRKIWNKIADLTTEAKINSQFNNIKNIEVNSRDEYYMSYKKMMDSSLQEVEEILRTDESIKNKQEKLEKINTPFSSKVKNLTYQIDPICNKAINEIDAIFERCKTPEALYKMIMQKESARFYALSKEKQKAIHFLFALGQLSQFNKESPALTIIFFFAKTIRKIIDNSDKFAGTQYEKIDSFNNKMELKLKETFFTLTKTSTIMTMAEELISQTIILDGMRVKAKEFQKNFVEKKNLNEDNEINKKDKTSETSETEDYELNEQEHIEFAILLAQLLENTKIIEESLAFPDHLAKHKSKVYKLSDKAIQMFFSIHAYDLVIPMVTEPLDWKTCEKSGMNFGGYMMNEVGAFPGVHLRSKKSVTKVDEETLKNVNYLQKNVFRINKTELDSINTNKVPYLTEYLNMSSPDWEECFYTKDNSMCMYTREQYVELLTKEFDTDLNSESKSLLEKTYIMAKKKKSIDKFNIKYKAVMSCWLKFEYMIKLANILSDHDFYFPVFLDGRGRFYVMGFGIFPHGDSLAKLLLILKIGEIKTNVTSDEEAQLEKLLKKEIIKGKDFFEFRKLSQKNRNVISLDVSNSGPQILAGLAGYKKGLIDTNFFVDKINENNFIKEDLYTNVLTKMQNEFKKNITSDILWSFEKYSQIQVGTPEWDKVKNIENTLPFIQTMFNRSLLKKWVMQFVYSEGDHARSIYLATEIEKQFNKVNKEKEKIFEFGEYYTMARVFSIAFVQAMEAEYPDICIMSNKIQELFTNFKYKGCLMTITSQENGLKTHLNCSGQKAKDTYYVTNKGQTKTKISVLMDTNKIDLNKIKRSVVANFIHNLDSEILKKVVTTFRLANKPIWVIHDCFLVNPDDAAFVKNAYFTAFEDCIFKAKPLENFICANLEGLTPETVLEYCDSHFPDKELTKSFSELNNSKIELYNKIKNNEIVASKRILS